MWNGGMVDWRKWSNGGNGGNGRNGGNGGNGGTAERMAERKWLYTYYLWYMLTPGIADWNGGMEDGMAEWWNGGWNGRMADGMAEWRNGGWNGGMVEWQEWREWREWREWQKEWQNDKMAEVVTYILFMVHTDTMAEWHVEWWNG